MSNTRPGQVFVWPTQTNTNTITPNSLETLFESAFERFGGELEQGPCVAEYIYKKGSIDEVHINLRDKPRTAKEFYELAVAIAKDQLAEKEDSYFFAYAFSPLEANYANLSEELSSFSVLKQDLEKNIKALHKSQEEIDRIDPRYFDYKRNETAKIQQQITALTQQIHDEVEVASRPLKEKMALLAAQIQAQKQSGKLELLTENLTVNLLFDAAQAGYRPALSYLAQLTVDPAYASFNPAIKQVLQSFGYRRIKNKDKKNYLDLWSNKKAPSSITELEKLARDLEMQGPVGTYYFLADHRGIGILIETLRKLAANLRTEGAYWIETQLEKLRSLARTGKFEEAKALTQVLLDTGLEVYEKRMHKDRLTMVTQDLLNLALASKKEEVTPKDQLAEVTQSLVNLEVSSQASEAVIKDAVLKTTGHHTQALKQPQLAAGIIPGTLSANPNTLLPQPKPGTNRPHSITIWEENEEQGLPAVPTTLTFS